MTPRELQKLGHPGHGSVFVHHLADDTGGLEIRQAAQIDRRLGLAGPFQHPSPCRLEREDMSRPGQIGGTGCRVHGGLDRARPVGGRDPRGHAPPPVDGDAERGSVGRGVLLHHQGETQFLEALLHHGKADEPPPVPRHEVDDLRRHLLGGTREIPLVLPLLVIHDNHHLAGGDVGDRLLDG